MKSQGRERWISAGENREYEEPELWWGKDGAEGPLLMEVEGAQVCTWVSWQVTQHFAQDMLMVMAQLGSLHWADKRVWGMLAKQQLNLSAWNEKFVWGKVRIYVVSKRDPENSAFVSR